MTGRPYTGPTHDGLSPAGDPTLHRGRKGLCPAPECRAARIPALALTVQHPHADAIAHDTKRTENRTWPIPPKHVGATVMIHAGKEIDHNAVLGNTRPGPGLRGVVIAVVRLAGCHEATTRGPRTSNGLLCCAPWGHPSARGKTTWHWDLDDVQALPTPIGASGLQKLWYPSVFLIEAVQAQMTGATP